ncbi:high affinity immunoglobulin gamma Fc receptor I, partial [Austrofundulus limnaeus]|uniref:high affinity immunoglobulin gamma Fc receptor I n=1 Tax=Austrofundulus limnaeus TaxID=52670 RepID=UPI0006B3BD7C
MKTWRVKQKLHEVDPEVSTETCNTSAPSCTIYPISKRHSGEYWCENDEGGVTNSVNISVTAGLVILDVPVRPVMEGSDLTLWCTNKKTDLKHISDFYKDGVLLSTGYGNNFIIQNVSKSDEGRYKCSISGEGESAESWLIVSKQEKGPSEESQQLNIQTSTIFLLCVTLVTLLLLIFGLVLYRKHK